LPKEKRKKGSFDIFSLGEGNSFSDSKSFSAGGSGYSLSVTYDGKGKPIVNVETQGDVDVGELRRDIEQRYPGAEIEGLEKQPLIRVVDEEPELVKKEKKETEKVKKRKKRPLIRVVE